MTDYFIVPRRGAFGCGVQLNLVVDGRVFIHDVDELKTMLFTQHIIVWIMGWCNFQSPSAEFTINETIGYDWIDN